MGACASNFHLNKKRKIATGKGKACKTGKPKTVIKSLEHYPDEATSWSVRDDVNEKCLDPAGVKVPTNSGLSFKWVFQIFSKYNQEEEERDLNPPPENQGLFALEVFNPAAPPPEEPAQIDGDEGRNTDNQLQPERNPTN